MGQARKRCWKYDWVLDLDIKGFFNNIDHELMMRAVRMHTDEKWVLLYLLRPGKKGSGIKSCSLWAWQDRYALNMKVLFIMLRRVVMRYYCG